MCKPTKDMNPGMWQHISILKIERVENGMQEDGSAEPYYKVRNTPSKEKPHCLSVSIRMM